MHVFAPSQGPELAASAVGGALGSANVGGGSGGRRARGTQLALVCMNTYGAKAVKSAGRLWQLCWPLVPSSVVNTVQFLFKGSQMIKMRRTLSCWHIPS